MRSDKPVETLLGRSVLDVGSGELAEYVAGSSVLVTGAGGSIGTELCRRLADLGPRELVLVDQAEAPLAAVARLLRDELGSRRASPFSPTSRTGRGQWSSSSGIARAW